MNEGQENANYIEKIGDYETVEILVNDKKEIVFDRIIDPVYIKLHFERIRKSSSDFDIIKMIGYKGNNRKEVIVEIIVGQSSYNIQ
jgi:hypothetical protein